MSLCLYTQNSNRYIFDPAKIEYVMPLHSTSRIFAIGFDSGFKLNIDFPTHDNGTAWIQQNLMSGECPSLLDSVVG